jgi:hypothetical protein
MRCIKSNSLYSQKYRRINLAQVVCHSFDSQRIGLLSDNYTIIIPYVARKIAVYEFAALNVLIKLLFLKHSVRASITIVYRDELISNKLDWPSLPFYFLQQVFTCQTKNEAIGRQHKQLSF